MRKEGSFSEGASRERKNEIERRAKADAMSFLEAKFTKNLHAEKLPRPPRKGLLRQELLEEFEPIWSQAYQDLGIGEEEDKRLYQETFLVEGGYIM